MPDLSQLPATPAAAPPNARDMTVLGRPPAPGAAPGSATVGYGQPLGTLAPAVLYKARITAGGVGQRDATLLAAPISIVVSAAPGTGVCLDSVANATFTLLNVAAGPVLVYPPVAGGTINALAAGAPVSVAAGGEVGFHSDDGVSFFAAA